MICDARSAADGTAGQQYSQEAVSSDVATVLRPFALLFRSQHVQVEAHLGARVASGHQLCILQKRPVGRQPSARRPRQLFLERLHMAGCVSSAM